MISKTWTMKVGSTTRYSHVTTIFIQMSTVTIEQEVPAIIAHDHQNARCQVMRKRERKQNHFFFFCDVWHFTPQWFFISILAFFFSYLHVSLNKSNYYFFAHLRICEQIMSLAGILMLKIIFALYSRLKKVGSRQAKNISIPNRREILMPYFSWMIRKPSLIPIICTVSYS